MHLCKGLVKDIKVMKERFGFNFNCSQIQTRVGWLGSANAICDLPSPLQKKIEKML